MYRMGGGWLKALTGIVIGFGNATRDERFDNKG